MATLIDKTKRSLGTALLVVSILLHVSALAESDTPLPPPTPAMPPPQSVAPGTSAHCGTCNSTGYTVHYTTVKTTNVQKTATSENSQSAEYQVAHYNFCGCNSGSDLAREAYVVLLVVQPHVERLKYDNDRQLPGWKGRLETARKQYEITQEEMADLQRSKADVKDIIEKEKVKLQQQKAEIDKCDTRVHTLERESHDLQFQFDFAKQTLEQAKKRITDGGEQLPPPVKRPPPPFAVKTFPDITAAASLKKAVTAGKAESSGAAQAPPTAGTKPARIYMLNDGREIKVKVVVENGDEVMIKGEDGKMITIKKADIKGIREE